MAYTQADVDALRGALAKGARKLTIGNETVEFNSPAEMRRQLKVMEDELSGGTSGRTTVHYARTSRGL